MPFLGEIAALATAACWVVSSLSFQSAGRRVGSLPVNFLRIFLAFFLLGFYTLAVHGSFIPMGASAHAWLWLSLSGLVGFVFGDLFLFKAFVAVGARLSMLVMASVPVQTALIGYLFLGERIGMLGIGGLAVTLAGIMLVVASRRNGDGAPRAGLGRGVFSAFLGAFGQAVGYVLSKYGMGDYDPFAATQIRVITGVIGFAFVVTLRGAWPRVRQALRDGGALARIATGAFFGPFLGVSLSLLAAQHTATGIAATLMATTPVLIIAPARLFFKEEVGWREVVGALVAVAGAAVIFLR